MKKKIIAGMLVLLAMSSAPAVSAALTAALPHKATAVAKKTHDHSCCPGSHVKSGLAVVAPLAFEPMPCDQLPCCMKRAPGNPSALPAITRLPRPDVQGNAIAQTETVKPIESSASVGLELAFASPFFVRSTVLRI